MEAGADVGIGILAVHQGHQPGEQIVPGKLGHPQVLPVGKQQIQGNDREKGHTHVGHVPLEALVVIPRQVQPQGQQHGKPQHVGDDEPLQKGNPVVQRDVGGAARLHGNHSLHPGEGQKVGRQNQGEPEVAVLPPE